MDTNSTFHFDTFISVDSYMTKDEQLASVQGAIEGKEHRKALGIERKQAYKRFTVTPTELLDNLLHGHTYAHLFSGFPESESGVTYIRKSDGAITMQAKRSEFFEGSYVLNIDIDNTQYENPRKFVSTLSAPPTIWHTSPSHLQTVDGVFKGNRFRLIYVMDNKITGSLYYRYCAKCLYDLVEHDTNEVIEDKCGLSPVQYMNGTNVDNRYLIVDYGTTNNIYSTSDIGITTEGYVSFLQSRAFFSDSTYNKYKKDIDKELIRLGECPIKTDSTMKERERHTQHIISESDFSGRLINDAERLPFDEFHRIYKHRYHYFYRYEDPESWAEIEDGIKIQITNSDRFVQLPYIPRKIKDGMHRRNTMFHRAWLRRLIYPDVTPDTLLYNLILDRERFFDNTDGTLSIDTLKNKVMQALEHPIDHYIENYHDVYENALASSGKKKFILHWSVKCRTASKTHIAKLIRWRVLDAVYDSSISLKENLQILHDSDIKIEKDALRAYCKARGINTLPSKEDKYARFRELHEEGMSIRKEVEYLKAKGLTIPKSTLVTYRHQMMADTNELTT